MYPKAEASTGLISGSEVQLNIFSDFKGIKYDKVSKVLDKLNLHSGAGTLRMAGEGMDQKWSMKRECLRAHYTTNWHDIDKS